MCPKFDLFSPENLERLAAMKDEPLELPGEDSTHEIEWPIIEVCGKLQRDGSVNIPLNSAINLGHGNMKTSIELTFKIDAKDQEEANKIRDRAERIKKLRQSIKVEASLGRLTIT